MEFHSGCLNFLIVHATNAIWKQHRNTTVSNSFVKKNKIQDLNKIYFVVSDEAVFSVNEIFFDRKRSWENQIYNSYHMNMVILPS